MYIEVLVKNLLARLAVGQGVASLGSSVGLVVRPAGWF
jgi:hypothetical protein